MVPPVQAKRLVELTGSGTVHGARTSSQLNLESVVICGCEKRPLQPYGFCGAGQAEVELLGVPRKCRVEVRHAHSCVIPLHRRERAGWVPGGREQSHDNSC